MHQDYPILNYEVLWQLTTSKIPHHHTTVIFNLCYNIAVHIILSNSDSTEIYLFTDFIFIDNNATLTSNTNTSYHRSKEKNSEPMCSNLQKWGNIYSKQHGYVSLTVCIFGIVANLLNILVLTRKEMNQSPINKILAGIILFMI